MGDKFDGLLPEVKEHIKKLVKTAGLENSDESLEMLSAGWLEKQESFFEQTKQKEMEETDALNADDLRGALVMTISGSLINIGPEIEDMRSASYYSIGLRNDVPESAEEAGSVLAKSVLKGETVEFEKGPIVKSSPAFAIAVFKEELELEPEAEEELLDEVTMIVAGDFASINKTTMHE